MKRVVAHTPARDGQHAFALFTEAGAWRADLPGVPANAATAQPHRLEIDCAAWSDAIAGESGMVTLLRAIVNSDDPPLAAVEVLLREFGG